MSEERELDPHGEEILQEWWGYPDKHPPEDVDAVFRVIDLFAARTPPIEIGHTTTDLASGDLAFTVREDLVVVVIPWGDGAPTFSLRFIGDVSSL